jgi:SAM-dependent methyltransferase
MDRSPSLVHRGGMSDTDHAEVVRSSFEQQTALFEGPNSPFASRSGSLSWIEPLERDMVVLDVACGAAHATESIAESVRQVVGIDLTRSLLDIGAERLLDLGIRNVTLQEGNAESLAFVDESFDVVFCRSSLHHFAHPLLAVSEMVRVCRGGGRIVLLDIIPPSADVRDLFDHLHRLIDPSHVRSFLESELGDLLPGGMQGLTYANTFSLRLPIDVACTEQSDDLAVHQFLQRELDGTGEPTGFEPTQEESTITVNFTTCVVHGTKSTQPLNISQSYG